MNLQAQPIHMLVNSPATSVNVLLVDDRLENLISLENLLKSENEPINYILCRSGEEALKIALKEELALILLDVQMPGMNGFEVAQLLKNSSRTRSIPIIFVTAIDRDTNEVLTGFESGAVDFLFKPLHPSITKAKVKAFIKIYLQNKELHHKNLLLKEKQQIIEESHAMAGIGTWEWDLIHNTIFWSSTLHDIFGLEKGKVLTEEEFFDTIYPEDREIARSLFNQAIASTEGIWYNYRALANGQVLYIIGKAKSDSDENGNPIKLTGYSQDITPLKESQILVEGVLDASLNAIWTLKAVRNQQGEIEDFIIMRANKVTEKVINRKPEALVGRTILDTFPGAIRTGLLDKYIDVVQRNEPLHDEYFYDQDGFNQWFTHQAVKLNDGLVLTFTDITERKQSEEALREAHAALAEANHSLLRLNNELEERVTARTQDLQKAESELRKTNTQLRRINADLDNFIYTASHDLKAPINNIEGLVEVLKRKLPADANYNDIMHLISQSIESFKRALKELTEVSKLESGQPADIGQVEISPLLEEVKLNIKDLIEANKADIVEQLYVPSIKFSRKNLRSIIYNLLSNAIKYASPERIPYVSIRTYLSPENEVVLSVKDNGLGVDEKNIPKLFNMFKRFHTHVEGSGVGLHIVKRIVENAGGRIEVDSVLEQETEFRVYFPQE